MNKKENNNFNQNNNNKKYNNNNNNKPTIAGCDTIEINLVKANMPNKKKKKIYKINSIKQNF